MDVWQIENAFGLKNLCRRSRPARAPGPGEVRLRLRAASLNYRDWLMVTGQYNPRQPLPLIPGSDAVGEVLELGPGVTRVAVGQRVTPLFAQRWYGGSPTPDTLRSTLGGPLDGVLAEECVVAAEGVVPVPPHLSDAEAATLPCAAVTAWSALFTEGALRPGETVLVQGTGGVALFALQFARLGGAEVIVTSSSDDKLARAVGLGARAGVNYRSTPDWGRAVLQLTGGRGVDHVIEVGGAGTLAESLKAVRPGGRISLVGILAGARQDLNVLPIFMRKVTLQGILVGHRASHEAMVRAMEAAELRPVVDRIFPFGELPAAFEHLAAGRHFGKVVVALAGAA